MVQQCYYSKFSTGCCRSFVSISPPVLCWHSSAKHRDESHHCHHFPDDIHWGFLAPLSIHNHQSPPPLPPHTHHLPHLPPDPLLHHAEEHGTPTLVAVTEGSRSWAVQSGDAPRHSPAEARRRRVCARVAEHVGVYVGVFLQLCCCCCLSPQIATGRHCWGSASACVALEDH